MHLASQYLELAIGHVPKADVSSYVVTPANETALLPALGEDASSYFYSACISIVDALRAVDAGFFTWATVKCYYSVFYSLRSILASNGWCVFYSGGTPFFTRTSVGASPERLKGQTHQAVMSAFSKKKTGHLLLSQEIDLCQPLKWLGDRRTEANYSFPRFSEPDAPEHFYKAQELGIRKVVGAYLSATDSLYVFDKDHAMIAYPLEAISSAGKLLAAKGGAAASSDERKFLLSKCRDRNGIIAPIGDLFRKCVGT